MMELKEYWKKFWKFLNEDSWPSFLVTLVIALIVIKFIFFPFLSFLTGTTLPLVIVESCSMHHYEKGFAMIFTSPVYEGYGIYLNDTGDWDFQSGFSKGDVIFVVGPDNIKIGDVIIFNAGMQYQYPLIHRVVSIEDGVYSTKGDNYKTNSNQLPDEKEIKKDQIIGKALFRIPAIGWLKLVFFDFGKPYNNRGFCS